LTCHGPGTYWHPPVPSGLVRRGYGLLLLAAGSVCGRCEPPGREGARACALVAQKLARAKFDESLEVAVNLGIDTRRGDSQVRGAAMMLPGTGDLGSIFQVTALKPDVRRSCAAECLCRPW